MKYEPPHSVELPRLMNHCSPLRFQHRFPVRYWDASTVPLLVVLRLAGPSNSSLCGRSLQIEGVREAFCRWTFLRMGSELLEIQPRELRFTFELKKQSSCLVRLSNKSDDYVAFKVKTTSPKRYCVRPNTGVIKPRSICDFTVTMQAQRTAPPEMQLKDKFLVQSTVVPFGSTDDDISPTFFSKERGGFIEECKLRVYLVSPPHSPVLQQFNGTLKQEAANESPALKPAFVKVSPIVKESSSFKDTFFDDHAKEIEDLKSKITTLESKLSEAIDVEDLRSKMDSLQAKLSEADNMIAILREEKTLSMREKDRSQEEIILLRRKAASKVQSGFPPFFVLFIWLVGIALGYLLRP